MNLVGKIFIVVIFVMSLVFMSLAMAVYAAHKNWRMVVMRTQEEHVPGTELGLKYQLEEARTQNDILKNEAAKAVKDLADERKAKLAALSAMQTKWQVDKEERANLEKNRADLEKARADDAAALSATQANATKYRKELDTQRTDLADARKDRDEHFKKVVELNDQLNQAVNEKELLRKRMNDLAKDLAKAEACLRHHGIDPNVDYASKSPPTVDGIVKFVGGDGIIEISLGSDQGVRKGHQLEVYRKGAYVGRIEVLRTEPNKSACKIDPRYQNANVMEGDRVASKLN
jgi:hypothetical protein